MTGANMSDSNDDDSLDSEELVKFFPELAGRRYSKKVYAWVGSGWSPILSRLFLYDGWNLQAELDALRSNSLWASYIWGLDLSGTTQGAGGVGGLLFASSVPLGNKVQAVCADGNGNIGAYVSLDSGTVSGTYDYHAFGGTVRAEGASAYTLPFRFSSKYQDDESQLYYYGLRYYSPGAGRWLSRDPIGEQGGQNIYAFSGNDLVNQWDLLGLITNREIFANFNETIGDCSKTFPIVSRQLNWVLEDWVSNNSGVKDALDALNSSASTINDFGSNANKAAKVANLINNIYGTKDNTAAKIITGTKSGAASIDQISKALDTSSSAANASSGIGLVIAVSSAVGNYGGAAAGPVGGYYSKALKGIDSAIRRDVGLNRTQQTLEGISIECSKCGRYPEHREVFEDLIKKLRAQLSL